MTILDKDIGLIEDYLDGKLHGKELDLFKQRLKSDTEFANQLQFRRKFPGLWNEADEYQKTRKEISQIIKQKKYPFYKTIKHYVLPIAAIIILMFGIYWIFIRQHKEDITPQENKYANTEDSINAATDKNVLLQFDSPEYKAKLDSANQSQKDTLDIIFPVNDNE